MRPVDGQILPFNEMLKNRSRLAHALACASAKIVSDQPVEQREVADSRSTAVRRVLRHIGRTLIVAAGTASAGVMLIAIGGILLSVALGEDPRSVLAFLWFWLPAFLLLPFVIVTATIPLVGVPVMALLRSLELESARAYAICGTIAGLALSPLLNWDADPLPAGPITAACAAYGAVAGSLFYWLFRLPVLNGPDAN